MLPSKPLRFTASLSGAFWQECPEEPGLKRLNHDVGKAVRAVQLEKEKGGYEKDPAFRPGGSS